MSEITKELDHIDREINHRNIMEQRWLRSLRLLSKENERLAARVEALEKRPAFRVVPHADGPSVWPDPAIDWPASRAAASGGSSKMCQCGHSYREHSAINLGCKICYCLGFVAATPDPVGKEVLSAGRRDEPDQQRHLRDWERKDADEFLKAQVEQPAPVGPKREQDKPKACRLCGELMTPFSPYDAHNDCAAHQPPPPAALTGHAGDCSIYRALVNGRDCDGICTCGYGWQQWRNDDITQLYSEERLNYMSKTPVDLPPPPAAPDAGTQEAEKICQNHPEHP